MENIPFLMISLTNRRGILSEISSSDRKTPLTSIIDLYKKDCFQKGNGRRKDRKPGDDNNRPTGSYTENRISRDRSEIVIPVTPAKVFYQIIFRSIRLPSYFSPAFLFRFRTRFHRLFQTVLQELVQVLVRQVVHRLVRHAPAPLPDLLRRPAARVIVVQETADMP